MSLSALSSPRNSLILSSRDSAVGGASVVIMWAHWSDAIDSITLISTGVVSVVFIPPTGADGIVADVVGLSSVVSRDEVISVGSISPPISNTGVSEMISGEVVSSITIDAPSSPAGPLPCAPVVPSVVPHWPVGHVSARVVVVSSLPSILSKIPIKKKKRIKTIVV